MIDKKDMKRFWSKVQRAGPDECWEWTASKTLDGYGQFWLKSKSRCEGAHG